MASSKRSLQKRNVVFLVSALLFALAVVGAVTSLISNSSEAKRRYDVLVATDAAGGDTETALTSLRSYIYGHMNTSIGSPTGVYPPIQLKGTYDRLVAVEQEKVRTSNQTLYDEATASCEAQFPAGQLANGRVQCVSDYVAARGVQAKTVPDGLYKFNFVSPYWSPDRAGWLVVAAIMLGINFLLQVLLELRLRAHIRHIS